MPATCIDLRTFADGFRVWNELEGRRAYDRDDAGELILAGRAGFMAPWDDDTLVACTHSRITTRRILAAGPGAAVVQDGDDGQNATFPAAHRGVVTKLLRLGKRRRLTAGHRQAAAERLAPFRFRSPGQQSAPDFDDPG